MKDAVGYVIAGLSMAVIWNLAMVGVVHFILSVTHSGNLACRMGDSGCHRNVVLPVETR